MFTHTQLDSHLVYYEHDGTDTIMDSFTAMVKSDLLGVRSNPTTMHIEVSHVKCY